MVQPVVMQALMSAHRQSRHGQKKACFVVAEWLYEAQPPHS